MFVWCYGDLTCFWLRGRLSFPHPSSIPPHALLQTPPSLLRLIWSFLQWADSFFLVGECSFQTVSDGHSAVLNKCLSLCQNCICLIAGNLQVILLPFQPKAIQPVDGFTVTLSFLPECITPRTDQVDQKVEEAETPASKSNMKQKFGIIVIQINYRLSEQAH